jgi:hypothetical protein
LSIKYLVQVVSTTEIFISYYYFISSLDSLVSLQPSKLAASMRKTISSKREFPEKKCLAEEGITIFFPWDVAP